MSGDEIRISIINILRHLKTIPLDEVHANLDACIEVFEEELQSSTGSANNE